ncbi:MAG: tRNA lysidine(34) synthetase TilS [Promethearchaeota archaeon]|jgi:tRNA(Ile)-lysidine synthase
MFKLTHPLPAKYWVAVSGGVDSMSALHWLTKPSRGGLLGIIHIDHGTEHAKDARWLVEGLLRDKQGINCLTFEIEGKPPQGESKEAWWRDRRYDIFQNQVPGYEEIILAHHFDDCLEEYIMNTMVRGYPDTIGYSHGRCIRPFRLWKKKDIISYAVRNKVFFVADPSNDDTSFKRNHIRHNIVPEILKLNPGVYNIVERCIEESMSYYETER